MKKEYLIALICSLMLSGCGDDTVIALKCSQDSACDSGKCLSNGQCAKVAKKGEKCSDEVVCAQDLVCKKGVCKEASTDPDDGCQNDNDCDGNKVCVKNECTEIKILNEGDACQADDKTAKCSDGLSCNDGKCAALKPAESCQTDADCANNSDGYTTCLESSVCGAIHLKGETCNSTLDLCDATLECSKNVCIQRANNGENCSEDEWVFCASNLSCIDGICETTKTTEDQAEDPGPTPEADPVTDDKDILSGISLPSKKPITDPCAKCTIDQQCENGVCVNKANYYVSTTNLFTDEKGGTTTIPLYLPAYPESDVKAECWILSESPYPEASVDCSDILIPEGDHVEFSPGLVINTHSYPITIKGLPDSIDDGTQKFYLMIKTLAGDSRYNNVIHSPILLMNVNVDTAGVIVKADKNLLTDENGGKATYTLALQSKPVAPVRLKLRSSDLTEGTVEPHVLDFTPDNWNTPQTVTVTGVDDEYEDYAQIYWISTKAVSADAKYSNIKVENVVLTSVDNDLVGVSLASNEYKLSPKASKASVSVVLNVKPSKNVKVKLDSFSSLLEIAQNEIEFTPDNWNIPQEIGLSTTKFSETTQAITKACVYAYIDDEEVDNVQSNMMCYDIYRHEALEFAYTGGEQTVRLLPGEYEVEVWGSQGAGSANGIGGFGGYSHGKLALNDSTNLFINVGGNTITTTAAYNFWTQGGMDPVRDVTSYNGGGFGDGVGGGATHIATVSGELKNLYDQRDKVIIVAGGGGGGKLAHGGFGGGEKGGNGNTESGRVQSAAAGGTQDQGGTHGTARTYGDGADGSFGRGGNAIGNYVGDHYDNGAAGGGGWFGGGGVPFGGGAGGGSGHLGSQITDGEMLDGSGNYEFPSPIESTELGHQGTGYARITIIEREREIIN